MRNKVKSLLYFTCIPTVLLSCLLAPLALNAQDNENNPQGGDCSPHTYQVKRTTGTCNLSASIMTHENIAYVYQSTPIVPIGISFCYNADWLDSKGNVKGQGKDTFINECTQCGIHGAEHEVNHIIKSSEIYPDISGDATVSYPSCYMVTCNNVGAFALNFTKNCDSSAHTIFGGETYSLGCGDSETLTFNITSVGIQSLTPNGEEFYLVPESRNIYVLGEQHENNDASQPVTRNAVELTFTAVPTGGTWPTGDPAAYTRSDGTSYANPAFPYPHWDISAPGGADYTFTVPQGSDTGSFIGRSCGSYTISANCGYDNGRLNAGGDRTPPESGNNFGTRSYNVKVVDPEVTIEFPECCTQNHTHTINCKFYKFDSNFKYVDDLKPCDNPYEMKMILGVEDAIPNTNAVFTFTGAEFEECFEILDSERAVISGNIITLPLGDATNTSNTYYIRALSPSKISTVSAFTICGSYTPWGNINMNTYDAVIVNWNSCTSCIGGTTQNIDSINSGISFGSTATGGAGGGLSLYTDRLDWNMFDSSLLRFTYPNSVFAKMKSGLTGEQTLLNGYPERVKTGLLCSEFSYAIATNSLQENYIKTINVKQYLSSDIDVNTAHGAGDILTMEYLYEIKSDVTNSFVTGLSVTQTKFPTDNTSPVITTWLYEFAEIAIPGQQGIWNVWSLTQNGIASRLASQIIDNANGKIRKEIRVTGDFDFPQSMTFETHREFDCGELIIESGDESGTVSYEYYTDGNSKNMLKKEIYSDGRSVEYTYDVKNRVSVVREKRGSLIYVTSYSNRNVDALQQRESYTVTCSIVDTTGTETVISETIEERSFTPSTDNPDKTIRHYKDAAGAIQSEVTSRYYTIGYKGAHDIRTSKIAHPNGTETRYTYSSSSPQETIRQGAFSGDNLQVGTISKTYTDSFGVTVKAEQYAVDIYNGTTSDGLLTSRVEYSNFDAQHRPQTTTYLNGRTTTKVYGCCGISTETDQTGAVTQYFYDDFGRIDSVVSTDGITTLYNYDAVGRQISVTSKAIDGSEITTYSEYDSAGRTISTTNGRGDITFYSYNRESNGTGSDVISIEAVMSPNSVNSISNYLNGELQSIGGTASLAQYNEYGPNWHKLMPHNITSYTDMLGRQSKTVYADNSEELYYYNNLGQLWKTKSPGGVITLYEYDSANRQIRQIIDVNRNSLKDAGDIITENLTSYETISGKNYVVNTSKTNGTVTGISKRAVDGSTNINIGMDGLSTTSTIAYNGNGQTTATVTAPNGSKQVSVSINGRTDNVKNYDSNNALYLTTSYSYDKFGRVAAVEEKNAANTVINKVAYTYDNNGNVLSSIVGVGSATQTTSYQYDANNRQIKVILPGNREKVSVYYPTGELKMEYGADTYPVQYTYDPIWGGVATMTTWQTGWNQTNPDSGNTTSWTYNNRGFMTKKTKADNSQVNYEYNADGNVTKRTWARGVVTNYAYDNAGRLTGKTYSDGTPSVNFTYDALGRVLTAGGLSYNYDATTGRVLSVGGMDYTYDAFGRLNSASDANNFLIVNYTYDVRGRLNSVSDGANTATYEFDSEERPWKSTITSNGSAILTQTRSYDDYNRLTGVTTTKDGTELNNSGYTYNTANQRITQSRSYGDDQLYTYDSYGQLETAKPANELGDHYMYDTIGNRTYVADETAILTYQHNATNAMTVFSNPVDSRPLTYDADGNLLTYDGSTYTWDGENRMKTAVKNGTTYTYTYDALNRRTSETVGGVTTTFVWDGNNLHSEIAGDSRIGYTWGKDLSESLHGAGGVGGLLWQKTSAGVLSYPTYDGNGNITAYVNANGANQAQYIYDAFLNGSTGTAYRFQASTKSWNNDLGLLDYQFRAYSPTLGRFIQEDPIEEQGGNNLYGFVGNNPVNRWDNLGLWLSSGHKKITQNAFSEIKYQTTYSDGKWKREKIKQKLIEIIITANVDTDSKSTTKNDQRYHYCRNMSTSESAGRTGYSTILKELEDKFGELLIVAGDTPENSCADALIPLGTLTHAWQDYYAHAVEKDDSWFGAKIGTITGNPDAPALIPVSFGGVGFRGGHGGFFRLINPLSNVEPGDRAPDSANRRLNAARFTRDKLVDNINKWLKPCKCEYENGEV